ncbi:site-specific integrase [Elizabethkingia anophelis]|nr:site-specific integrase [Elizabethkingia anophelis]MCT4104471.1 site-specific integrase [Elizabethkingia anophelis]
MKSYSEMKVYPKSWETSKSTIQKDWIVRYEFTDRKGKTQPTSFKGMNHVKDYAERVKLTKQLIEEEQDLLDKGWNPKTEMFEDFQESNLITSETLFLKALKQAIDSKKLEPLSKSDMINSLIHIEKYSKMLKLHSKKIGDIVKGDIKQLLMLMSNMGHSNYRINKTRTHLSSCYKVFTDLDIFNENYIKGISALEHTPNDKNIIRNDSQWDKLNKLKDIHYYLHRFAIIFFYSGSRIIEVLGVKKEDVIIEKGLFWITVKKGGMHRREMRAINMHSLSFWQEAVRETGFGQYVFSHNLVPGHERANHQNIYKIWSRYADIVQLNVTLYSLKYSFLNQVSKYYGLSKAQEVAGHTNEKTTKRYALDHKEHQVERNKNIDIKIG